MRRILGIVGALALVVSLGCSGTPNNKFDEGGVGGNGAGGNVGGNVGSTSGSSGSGSGSTGGVIIEDGGGNPDAGPCGDLAGATLTLQNATSPVSAETEADTTIKFVAKNSSGDEIVGCPVSFSEPSATDVPVIINPASVPTDPSGVAATVVSASLPGSATILAKMQGIQDAVVFNFSAPPDAGIQQVDAGPQNPTTIAWQSTYTPDGYGILGIAGSGIDEQGSMIFKVTDQNNKPIPNLPVTFSESPAYAPLTTTSATTNGNGEATASFHSGSQVNIAHIVATVTNLQGASISTSHDIPVRGAKPSAGGFSFYCSRLTLPVYTTSSHTEQMTCTVQLVDRFSNPVGIPTPVTFHTEAGSIGANATTAPYDQSNPAAEGTAQVTFTANFSGTPPADVAPITGEPKVTAGSSVKNPRDRLVTIIAITTGEERFDDANNNGAYDPGETFYDMTDPYIDENDDNQWDETTPGGQHEPHYPASENPSDGGFSYGNGVWDSTATIWKATHVVFSGLASASNTDTFGNTPGSMPACIPAAQNTGDAPIFAYDDYFNLPTDGTTFSAQLLGSPPGLTSQAALATPLAQTPGEYGSIFISDQNDVSVSDGGACVSTNGDACRTIPLITGFDDGKVGDLIVTNSSTVPDGGAACVGLEVQGSVTNLDTNGDSFTVTNSFGDGTFEP